MAGQILTMMFGGKQVAVLTSGAASQIGGKAVQLFFAGGQQMVTNSDGLVTSEAALAQLAGESGLVEGEGVTWQLERGVLEHGGDMSQAQLGGWMVTPQEGGSEAGDQLDIQQYLDLYQAENTVDMYSTQVDGDAGDDELDDPGTVAQPGEEYEVPAVPVAGPGPEQGVLISNQAQLFTAETWNFLTTLKNPDLIKRRSSPVALNNSAQQMVLLSNDVEKNPGPPRLVQMC